MMTIADYIRLADEIEVDPYVPDNITQVIDQAKQLYIYGYCNHSFFTITVEKVIFAFEAAVEDKYKKLGGPKKLNGRRKNLENMIKYLLEHGFLDNQLWMYFEIIRRERNSIAHTKEDRSIKIADMTISLNFLEFLVSTINQMYRE